MARDLSNLFSLVVPDNISQNAALPAISKTIAFDDLGDFIEERDRIRRKVELSQETEPKVDYSDFANHVFFDSALSKFNIAKNKILTQYPFAGDSEDKDLFTISGSFYESYVLSQWPHFAGYAVFNGVSQYISASDVNGSLFLGSSSLYVSARAQPVITGRNAVLQMLSSSGASKYGYELYFSGTSDPYVKFSLYSGSTVASVSASYPASLQSSFNGIAAMYDSTAQMLYMYVNRTAAASASVSFAPINLNPAMVTIGSGSSFSFFSGALDEIRILHTASDLYHAKNYARPITSENFVKLYYKFNEGIVGTSSIDTTVIDYSKSALHGQIVNYNSSVRFSGSSMQLDPGDPILYSFHSGVLAYGAIQTNSASLYDNDNRNYILRLIPSEMLTEDQDSNGILISFSLAMARYFDELKSYVDQFGNLRVTNYDGSDETPDVMLPLLKKYFGWKVTDHFGDANPLEFFFGENVQSTGSLATSLSDIRNEFWRRILNNLPYLYKTKGKRNNLDAFFNVLGLNSNLLNLKEYGFLNYNTINDEYIHKEKPIAFLGMGTGSFGSGSFVKVSPFLTASKTYNEWTIETTLQLPYASASYATSLLTGSIWQMTSPTGSYALLWNVPALGSLSGTLILSASDGQAFSASGLGIFGGQFAHVAVGLQANSKPFIAVRTLDSDRLSLSTFLSGNVVMSGALTASNYDLVIGATSGSAFKASAQGYFGSVRYWQRQLSASELDSHALNIESIGTQDPLAIPNPLIAYWGLNESKSTSAAGTIDGITDLSRNRLFATGSNFPTLVNPYTKFLTSYNFVSPSADLKWTQNKVRVRNKTELTVNDVANDTNQVVLEFNLIDALNEDISKIFTSITSMNNVIGSPVNKYRDSYEDLEGYRRAYFDRLSTSLNFTNFFKLFRWFDKKLASSIKQLLPARVDFIGGEFVVESHFLERNKYQYKYPFFKTPRDVGIADLGQLGTNMSSSRSERFISSEIPVQGTYVRSDAALQMKWSTGGLNLPPRPASVVVEASKSPIFRARTTDGHERIDRNPDMFFRRKVSGDTLEDTHTSSDSVNYKNEYSRRTLERNLANNRDGYRSGAFIDPSLGNGFLMREDDSAVESLHYNNVKKTIELVIRGLSGSGTTLSSSQFVLSGSNVIELSQSLWDLNNVLLDTGSFTGQAFNCDSNTVQEKYNAILSFSVSGTLNNFSASDISVQYKDGNSSFWSSYRQVTPYGSFMSSGLNDNWYRFETRMVVSGAIQHSAFSFNRNNVQWFVSGTAGKVYAFKDVSLRFSQPMSDYGVSLYRSIDNQNNKKKKLFANVNRNVMPNIEDGVLRETSYYNWNNQNINYVKNSQGAIFPAVLSAIAKDSANNLYAVGSYSDATLPVFDMINNPISQTVFTPPAERKWCVLKSTDFGLNWKMVDDPHTQHAYDTRFILFGAWLGSHANDVVVDSQGFIHVGGFISDRVSGQIANFAIIRSSFDSGLTWRQTYKYTENFALNSGMAGDCFISAMTMNLNNTVCAAMNIQGGTDGLPNSYPQGFKILTATSVGSATTSGTYASPVAYYELAPGNFDSSGKAWAITSLKPSRLSASVLYYCGTFTGSGAAISLPNKGAAGYVARVDLNSVATGLIPLTITGSCIDDIALDSQDRVSFLAYFSASATVSPYGVPASGNFPSEGWATLNPVWKQNKHNLILDSKNNLYLNIGTSGAHNSLTKVSTDFGKNWRDVDNVPSGVSSYRALEIVNFTKQAQFGNDDVIYMVGEGASIRTGQVLANSSSIGPRSLATSLQFVNNESSGNTNFRYKLNNISEFPHYGGFFQMRSMILGTQTTGKIGRDDQSIIQVNHIGSVVKIMWPMQSLLDAPVKGFGELAIGQSPGKLSNSFVFGDLVDVADFDHISLYCFVQKQISGTMDDIVIQVQRRPLSTIGFATDQSVEYSQSGSFTEARYKDILHTKQIDYGDLTLREIGYPIDIPLVNVRQIRIGARHKNGQSDLNQNFIVWGRLIKSTMET